MGLIHEAVAVAARRAVRRDARLSSGCGGGGARPSGRVAARAEQLDDGEQCLRPPTAERHVERRRPPCRRGCRTAGRCSLLGGRCRSELGWQWEGGGGGGLGRRLGSAGLPCHSERDGCAALHGRA
eukprot:scaffold295096_cov32-Tisochrysis_lutea.AAC.1